MREKFLLKILPMTLVSTFAIADTKPVTLNGILSAAQSPYASADAKSGSSLAVGAGTTVGKGMSDSMSSVAVGTNSAIEGSPMSTVVGPQSKIASSNNSIIIGSSNMRNSNFGVVIGNQSSINNAEYGVAIGGSAKVTNKNSVSLGGNSTTDRDNSISVGNNDLKRQITFVADGLKDSDAATVNQVNKSADSALKSANNYTDRLSENALSNAKIYTDSKITISGNKLFRDSRQYTDQKADQLNNRIDQVNQYTDQKADQLNNRINQVNKRIDKGLASSAALTGLFQPYGVGKVNFTAGIGGYRSTQALAIGSGYRVNENAAIKAGMALSDSKNIMYNASFNLEW